MKSLIILFLVFTTFGNAHAETLEEKQAKLKADLEKLDERLTDMELEAIKSKITLGFDLKVDSAYMTDRSKIVGENPTSHNGYVGSILARLNLSAALADSVNVYAAAESFSYLNDTLFNNTANANARENQDKGEKIVLNKAYFDWKFYKDWITFSAGRLPTTQGPPAHIKDGVSREGTYPLTGYSVPLDGFALTTKLSSPLEMKDNLSLRFIYKPGGSTKMTHPYRGVDAGDYTHPGRVTKSHNLYSGMIEYEQTKENALWDKMLAILQFGYYKFGSPNAYQVSGLQGASDYELYRLYFTDNKFLDAKIISPYIEFDKVFKTQFDFYATMAITRSETFGKARAVILTGAGAGTDFEVGPFLHSGKATGTRFITGARYEFPQRYFLGAEFMKASEKSLPTVFYSNSPLSPNYFNGKSYEIYALKQMYNNNFIVRLGYTRIDVNADISNDLFFRDTVERIQVASLSFDLRI